MSDTTITDTPSASDGPPVAEKKPLFRRYQGVWYAILEENKLLRLVALSSFVTSIFCLGYLTTQGDRTRTYLVPFVSNAAEIWVTGDEPSEAYLEAISRNVISLLGTFTGSSADYQFEQVLSHVHPSVYGDRRDEFRALAKDVRSYREVSFATYVRAGEPIDVYPDRIDVPVTRKRFMGRTLREDNGRVRIGYVIEGGRFYLLSYDFVQQGGDRVQKADQ